MEQHSATSSSMPNLIDGRAIAEKVYVDLRREIAELKAKGVTPGLAVVLVGDDPASRAYVRSKDKMCRELGLHSVKLELPASTTQTELLQTRRRIECRLDHSWDSGSIAAARAYRRSSDRARARPTQRRGRISSGERRKACARRSQRLCPVHAAWVQRLLIESKIEINGAHVVVLGRSMIVGKPLALLLMQKNENANATVTVVHSRSRDLAEITRSADIIVAAIGRAEFVKADHVREGAVVIDVGINRVEDAATERGYRLVGDVAFDEVSKRRGAITPVPGGVGPMTIAMLMSNTVKAARQSL